MQVSVSNIAFVQDERKPGRDRLVAVFSVSFSGERWDDEVLDVEGFRYYQPSEKDGYVAPPSIKTKHGIVRPVKLTTELRLLVHDRFIKAWEKLPTPPATVPDNLLTPVRVTE